MYLLRNVHDAIPCRMTRGRIAAFAEDVRARLGVGPGPGVVDAFHRLGGTYLEVPDTLGRRTDHIVIRGPGSFTYEDRHELSRSALGLAECLGTLFLHHPLVTRAHGPDAVTAVRRFAEGEDGDRRAALDEAICFAVHFAMPAVAFREAVGRDPSARAVADAFGIHVDTAARRARALELELADVPERVRERLAPREGLAPAAAVA